MSNLTDHARREMEIDLGRSPYVQDNPFTKLDMEEVTTLAKQQIRAQGGNSDEIMETYFDMVAASAIQLVQIFSSQGHSGMSASITLQLFNQLANFRNTSPLTDDPAEWIQHAPDNWQSKRNTSCFSSDQGKTYLDNSEVERNENGTYKRDSDGKPIQPTHKTIDHTKPREENA